MSIFVHGSLRVSKQQQKLKIQQIWFNNQNEYNPLKNNHFSASPLPLPWYSFETKKKTSNFVKCTRGWLFIIEASLKWSQILYESPSRGSTLANSRRGLHYLTNLADAHSITNAFTDPERIPMSSSTLQTRRCVHYFNVAPQQSNLLPTHVLQPDACSVQLNICGFFGFW